jgi:hypothetical protein
VKPSALAIAVLAVAFVTAPAHGTLCAADRTPAATLLLPYFEVNLDDPNGLTTLFSVNNASAVAVIAHVEVWSDLAVDVFGFNVYLTGFDVQTINLRDILVQGSLPRTASAGQDPADTISPKGAFSQDIVFASCTGKLPPPQLPGDFISHLQLSLTGRASPVLGGLCAGQALGDNVARGYITIDTVSSCTLRGPADAGYFGPQGDATDQNLLWGTFFIIDSRRDYAQGSDLVALEASATNPATSTAGRYTFYGRYVGWSGSDHREPLPTTFESQFLNGGAFAGGTDMIVWRDSKLAQAPFNCPATPGSRPPRYPLAQRAPYIFDEQEHPVLPFLFPCDPIACPPPPTPFVASTQRVHVGGSALPVPYTFGFLYLDMNQAFDGNPSADPAADQAWVLATLSANAHYSIALDAWALDDACNALHVQP